MTGKNMFTIGVVLIVITCLVASVGCIGGKTKTTPDLKTESPGEEPGDVRNIPVTDSINIDGGADDWSDIPVFIVDAPGDVRTTHAGKTVHEFDVTNIKFATDRDDLFVLIEFARDVDYYFEANKEHSNRIGTFFLDTDNSKNTGGKEFFSKVGGFESELNIDSGVKGGKTTVYSGTSLVNLPDGTELEPFVAYHAAIQNETVEYTPITFASDSAASHKSPDLIAYNANFIELKVPVEDLNIQPDDNAIIRVLFSELGSGTGMGESTFSYEAIGEIG